MCENLRMRNEIVTRKMDNVAFNPTSTLSSSLILFSFTFPYAICHVIYLYTLPLKLSGARCGKNKHHVLCSDNNQHSLPHLL